MTAELGPLEQLLVIQDHDRSIDGLRHRRATLPELDELSRIERDLAALDAASGEVATRRHELERSQRRLEDEVALLEARIAQEDAKLYGGEVVAIKDLQALQDEISGLRDRQRRVEDQILEVMETAEPVDAELERYADKRADLDRSRQELLAAIEQRRAEIDAEVDEVTARRYGVAEGLDADLLATYERIRSQPGRVGVARLVGLTCHGCHLELPAVEVDRLKKLPADQLVTCDECGCILVR